MEKQDWLDWQEHCHIADEISRRLDNLCIEIVELWKLSPDDMYTTCDIERSITNTLYRCMRGDFKMTDES